MLQLTNEWRLQRPEVPVFRKSYIGDIHTDCRVGDDALMPWFGKKKQEEPPISKLTVDKCEEFRVPGPSSGLVFCTLQGKEAICASALHSKKIVAMTTAGAELWEFNTSDSVFSLAKANFAGKDVVIAGAGGKVLAISGEGEKLWEYAMPEGSGIIAGLSSASVSLHELQNEIGFEDVYHIATGKLNGDDVVVAVAGGRYMTEGPQVITSSGERKCGLKTKTLGMTRPIQIAGCLLDLSPTGDALLGIVAYKAYGKASVITEEAKTIRDIKFHIDEARKMGGALPIQDKRRGKLVGGKFGDKNVFIVGTPNHVSVAAVSLDGTQLWNYFSTRAIGPMTGVNDIKIGSLDGKHVVIIGCNDGSVHVVDEAGRRLDSWEYPVSVTNVDWGKIEGKDAIAIGLYNGQILTYVIESALA